MLKTSFQKLIFEVNLLGLNPIKVGRDLMTNILTCKSDKKEEELV